MNEKTIQKMFEIICSITSTYKYQFAIDIAKRAMKSGYENKIKNIDELKTSIDNTILFAENAQNRRLIIENSLHRKKYHKLR